MPLGAEFRTIPWTHSGSSMESAPMLDSTTRSKTESASSPRENEKFPSPVLDPVEMSVVMPERTPFTDRPRSENPPMKNATPVIPSEESSSGISREGPESDPVGISTDRLEGRGSISARTFNGRVSLEGALPMLIRIAFLPSMVAKAVPIPALPEAPSSSGGIHPTSLTPETVAEREEVLLVGSWWNRKWSPSIDSGADESLIWASIISIAESDDQEITDPEVVENELGNPDTRTAWR